MLLDPSFKSVELFPVADKDTAWSLLCKALLESVFFFCPNVPRLEVTVLDEASSAVSRES